MNTRTTLARGFAAATGLLACVSWPVSAAVTLVEPGHLLNKIVDSVATLHPSQSQLETACALGGSALIESIGTDRSTGMLYVQLADPGAPSSDSCIFSVTPAGVVTLINPSTGFGINSRGTDLLFDPGTGLLVTMDDNWLFSNGVERLATVLPTAPGTTGTYATLPPVGTFIGATLGLGISTGPPGTDVPAGQIVFTADVVANGIYSAPFGGPQVNHLTTPAGGDDVVVQPDGDWVWFGDGAVGIINYSPVPPHAATPSGFDVATVFANAGLTFIFGTRAAVCPSTGEIYFSFSGFPGGTGIFRINEALTAVTHLATISAPQGLQDLEVGVSSSGIGGSVYFTSQAPIPGGPVADEVWEITLPECVLGVQPIIPTTSPLGLLIMVLLMMAVAHYVTSRRVRDN